MLEGGLLSSDEFVAWSRNHVRLLHVTSQVEGEPYPDLLSEKGFRSFPSIAFLDGAGEVIAVHSGVRDLDGLAKTAARADEYLGVRAAAAAGDAASRARLVVHDIELGRFDYTEGQLRLDAARDALTPEQVARADTALIGIQYNALAMELSSRAGQWTREEYMQQHEQLAELFWRAGRTPSGRLGVSVLRSVLRGAERASDRDRFAAALAEFRRRYGDQDAYASRIAEYERVLEGM